MEGHKLTSCTNCGFNTYTLVDGYYYCTECDQQCENQIAIEFDEFTQQGERQSKLKVKSKESNKKSEDENALRRTSFEEYNYILHGLTNEILEIEAIPNFKVTVLQLWIAYLKEMEAGFFEAESQLPKLNIYHRRADAEILYNQKPKPKKKYTKKEKVNIKNENIVTESVRKRKRKIRKGLAALDSSEASYSSCTSMSSLLSLSVDEISSAREALELKIEYSSKAKHIQRKVMSLHKRAGKETKINEDGCVEVKYDDFKCLRDFHYLLNDKTILYILYCALNICKSNLQLGDLLRLAREGHISFYNFRKLIPEHLMEPLSLTKGHSSAVNKFSTIRMMLPKFISLIPDLENSFKTPDILELTKRYVKDLSLPYDLEDYIERLINFMPPNMKSKASKYIPNFEARAMAYILFVLKLLFGIDGYREIEISKSAKKLNNRMKKTGCELQVFVYEEWREYIAYRDIVLSKYYYPYILSKQYEGDKPYESFIAMLDHVKSDLLYEKKRKHNIYEKKREEKFKNSQKLAAKLLALYETDEQEEALQTIKHFSLTPHYNAMNLIINSNLRSKLIPKYIEQDHRHSTCDLFLKSEEDLKNFIICESIVEKCTFPKTFCFKQKNLKQNYAKAYKVVHNIAPKQEDEQSHEEDDIEKQVEFHKINYEKILKNRESIMDDVNEKRFERIMKESNERNFFDNLFKDSYYVKKISKDEISDITDVDVVINTKRRARSRRLLFIIPDFNLWHVNVSIQDYTSSSLKNELSRLPKSFRWLLSVASNIIYQEESDVYRQLVVIEKEFISLKSVELFDSQPMGSGTYW